VSDQGAQNAPSGGRKEGVSNTELDQGRGADAKGGIGSGNPNMAAGEHTAMIDSSIDVQLSEHLRRVRDRLLAAFPDAGVSGFRGELTVEVDSDDIVDVLTFCRDEPELRCEMLSDLSCVHWPGGKRRESAQETTGWPAYEIGDEAGRIEMDYIARSLEHNHRFRIRTYVPDDTSVIASVAGVYRSAIFMEREAYDFFGVEFTGHPDLRRILMPDEWQGRPLRKDYPLGGVEVQYKGATIPPPDQRTY
jgi:NADH:ubiquinone oxidoreductase subunit C